MIEPELREEGPQVTSRTLRQFAGLWLVFFGGLAGWEYVVRGRPTMALVLAMVAVLIALVGLVTPLAIQPLFVGLLIITRPIGWLVSKILLMVLYYGVFTPVGLLFKVIGRDALGRRRQPEASTYWQVKPAPAEMGSYFRQS